MACSGSPAGCVTLDIGWCNTCGCNWDIWCKGTPLACNLHVIQANCVACGCDWGTNLKINVGDVWRDVVEIKINVGDSWRTVTAVYINVGDSWRQVF